MFSFSHQFWSAVGGYYRAASSLVHSLTGSVTALRWSVSEHMYERSVATTAAVFFTFSSFLRRCFGECAERLWQVAVAIYGRLASMVTSLPLLSCKCFPWLQLIVELSSEESELLENCLNQPFNTQKLINAPFIPPDVILSMSEQSSSTYTGEKKYKMNRDRMTSLYTHNVPVFFMTSFPVNVLLLIMSERGKLKDKC